MQSVVSVHPNGVISEWAFDRNEPDASVDVEARIDGESAAFCYSNIERPDVEEAYPQFDFGIAGARVGYECHLYDRWTDGDTRTVEILMKPSFDLDAEWVSLGSSTFAVENAPPTVFTDSHTPGEISGWAIDLDRPGQAPHIDFVSYSHLDDEACDIEIETGLARPDVAQHFGVPSTNGDPYGWRVTYDPSLAYCEPGQFGDDEANAVVAARDVDGNRVHSTYALPVRGAGIPL